MVSICLEYVENRAEQIFIYCSFEEKVISSDFFYYINGEVVRKHKLNEAIDNYEFQYDTSIERQKGVMNIINENIEEMIKLCEEHNKDMPSEIKIIYNVHNNSLKAEYKYDLVYSNQADKTADEVSMEWFEQIKTSL
jgi:hypothetical protein